MQARRGVAWLERDVVTPEGERISYFELEDDAPCVRVVKDGRGTKFALFSFPEGDERIRFVLVSPGLRGRLTFYRDRKDRRFDYPGETELIAFDATRTPADVAMLIQHRFGPIPA